jgi:ribonuclease BN (tRNA processing enzyme)
LLEIFAVKAIFLGTNGWCDTDTGNTICVLVKTANYDIIFDAGNGFFKLDQYIASGNEKPVYLFLSHFHLDHIVGLHTLTKHSFPNGLFICGPEGTRNVLKTFINEPFTVPLSALPFRTMIAELPRQQGDIPFGVISKPLLHVSATLGYRIEIDEKIISYCTDTGYCENAVNLAKEADLLVAECAFRSGQTNESWPHLNPENAARVAKEANAKRLALVHFDAATHQKLEDRKESENIARAIFSHTFATEDGMEIDF